MTDIHVIGVRVSVTQPEIPSLYLEEAFGEFYNFVVIISRSIIIKELSLTNIQSSH